MHNPFEDLGKPRLENPQGEEVEGQFSCQEHGCRNFNKVARFIAEAKVLTWQCEDGHISKIEGFDIG